MAKLKVSFLKNIFSASNSFMHTLNMSVTHLQNAEKIQWKLLEERSWFHKVYTINHNLLGAVVWKWLS